VKKDVAYGKKSVHKCTHDRQTDGKTVVGYTLSLIE